MNVLYAFPQTRKQEEISGFNESLDDGTGPNTLFLGMNLLPDFGVSASALQTRGVSLLGRLFAALGMRWDPLYEARLLLRIGHYDVGVINDLATAPVMGLLRRFHMMPTPIIYFDVVVSQSTPLKKFLGWIAGGAWAVVYCSPGLEPVLLNQLSLARESIHFVPWAVDTDFWKPTQSGTQSTERPLILSAGFNDRDYTTLLSSVSGLNVRVEIATTPGFASRAPNVQVHALSPHDLRRAYGKASLVVVPLAYNHTASGVTTMLEAMAMSKPVVATRTPATEYYSDDGRFVRLVAPGDSARMSETIQNLLSNAEARERLGMEARRSVERRFSTARQSAFLAGMVKRLRVGDKADESPRVTT